MEEFETPEVERVEQTEVPDSPESHVADETPAYEPNFKYRVGDSELEFDERVRSVVTSKEHEDYLRDLYTKAHGLDLAKSRHEEKQKEWQKTFSEYSQLQETFGKVQDSFSKLDAIKDSDFGLFQKRLQISDQAVLRRALEIAQVHDNPQERDRLERSYQDRIQKQDYQDRLSHDQQAFRQQSQTMQAQLHEMKMAQAMANQEIQKFASEYDRRLGQPGAFVEEVNRLGTIEYHASNGRYLDPSVAVSQAHQRLSKLIGPLNEAVPASTPQAKDPEAPKRPALPNMGTGRTGTAVSKKPRTLDDIRKLANQLE